MKKRVFVLILALVMLMSVSLSACKDPCSDGHDYDEYGVCRVCGKTDPEFTPATDSNKVSVYQGDSVADNGKLVYNKDLFYVNERIYGAGADPFILDNVSRDGYYYLYSTFDFCNVSRSRNLVDWENMGSTLPTWKMDRTSSEYRTVNHDIWAPEVIYDADTELYYMFFSASPDVDANAPGGKGVSGPSNPNDNTPSHTKYSMFAATADSPLGPFKLVDFSDPESCLGEENLHVYNTTTGIVASDGDIGVYDSADGVTYKAAYTQFFAKYLFFNPESYNQFGSTLKLNGQMSGGFVGAIDPHPYVDHDGKKYLYFVNNVGENGICVVEMENWLKPKWETAQLLTVCQYYNLTDWENAKSGKRVQKVSYENANNVINEGPAMTYRNGLYYLTFSVNDYAKSDYSVGIAVSKYPNKDFRKLTEAEGGLFLNTGILESNTISGSGHHSFVTAGDQMFVCYHRHIDYAVGGGPRYPAIDEVKWVTVKDKDGKNLDVMYVNGPTDTVQPLPEKHSQYKNIASKANVTASPDTEYGYLTDGLIAVQKSGDQAFTDYIPETVITQRTTFTFEFAQPKALRAIMAYNSMSERKLFRNIARVELTCVENGQETVRILPTVAFNTDAYTTIRADGTIGYCISGSAAYAEFNELNVKKVKMVFDVPDGQQEVAISEIKLLGKDAESPNVGNNKQYALSNPSDTAVVVKPEMDSFIAFDGSLDEDIYKQLKWLNLSDVITAKQYADIALASLVTEKGIYLVADVTEHESHIYYNPARATYLNSCLELYMALDGQQNLYNYGTFEIDMTAGGGFTVRTRGSDWMQLDAAASKSPVLASKTKGGDVNTDECYGYTMEFFIPMDYLRWVGLDVPEDPQDLRLRINPAHVFSFNYDGTHLTQDRRWSMIGTADGVLWADCPTWYSFGANGLNAFDVNYNVIGSKSLGKVSEKNGREFVLENAQAVFTIEKYNNSVLKTLRVNGVDMRSKITWDSNGETGTLIVPSVTETLNIDVEFVRDLQGTAVQIEPVDAVNGSVTFDKKSYVFGSDVVITVTPNEGYLLKSLIVNGLEEIFNTADNYTKLTLKQFYGTKLTVRAKFVAEEDVDASFQVKDGRFTFGNATVKFVQGSREVLSQVSGGKVSAKLNNGFWTAYVKINNIFAKVATLDMENAPSALDLTQCVTTYASMNKYPIENVDFVNGTFVYNKNKSPVLGFDVSNGTASGFFVIKLSMTENDLKAILDGGETTFAMYVVKDGVKHYVSLRFKGFPDDDSTLRRHLCFRTDFMWDYGGAGDGRHDDNAGEAFGYYDEAAQKWVLTKYGKALTNGGCYMALSIRENGQYMETYLGTSKDDIVAVKYWNDSNSAFEATAQISEIGINMGMNWGSTDVCFTVSEMGFGKTLDEALGR